MGLACAFASQPYYGRVQFELKPSEVAADTLASAVQRAADDRSTRIVIRESGRRVGLEQAHVDLLRVLRVLLDDEQPFQGAELDLFIGPRGRRVPVTVRWETDAIHVETGPVWTPVWQRTSRGIIAGRYGLASIEDGSRPWNRALLGMVERAFERLDERERAILVGMSLRADHRYEPALGEPHVPFRPGAMYRADDHTIQVFDASFGPSFVGGVHDPEPVGVFMLLHEIAHAFDASADGQPPSERFAAEVPGVTVTAYGATSREEAFAEAFALWRTDRAALVRISPEAARFFDDERHLGDESAVGATDTGP